jgi:non-specific serine/threonine protein kinase/serine/threonine-protein kinase
MRTRALVTGSDARAIGTVVDWPHGELVGIWRVTAPLGCGGTAEVWHAVAADGREAALKLLKRELRRHPAASALLRHEHAVLRAVASPRLVEAYELVEGEGTASLALEYLPHGDLVPLLGMPPRHWLPAFRTVVAALADLERHGLAHGDLKASNVLFAADGSARLADLTSARPLDAPAAVTTAAYGPPAARRASARDADCFALGVLLFQLLTARLPYGPGGAADAVVAPPVVAGVGPQAAPLLDAAIAALKAGGRVQGLSYFTDVIESACAK